MKTKGIRIKAVRGSHGLTQGEFADRLSASSNAPDGGITRGAVGNWERDQGIKTENLQLIAEEFHVPFDWLATGRGPNPLNAPDLVRVKISDNGDELGDGPGAMTAEHRSGIPKGEIPQVDASLGAGLRDAATEASIALGAGTGLTGVPVLGSWKIPQTVLRRRIRTSIGKLHFIECEGDSMEPRIKDGDVVLIDQSRTNPQMPGIFALWEGDGQTLKRVERVQGSSPPRLRLIPANAAYSPYEVLAEDVQIIGRYVARFTVD